MVAYLVKQKPDGAANGPLGLIIKVYGVGSGARLPGPAPPGTLALTGGAGQRGKAADRRYDKKILTTI